MLAATDLPVSAMPTLHEGTEATGRLRPELAAEWGLDPRTIVAGGGGDNAAGGAGIGVVSPGRAFLSLGTSGVYFVATPDYRPNPDRGVHTFCHCLPGTWHQMAVILSAAAGLSWLAKLTGADEATLLAEAQAAPPAAEAPLFLPYLSGERTPHNDPGAKGVFFGLSHASDRAQLTQAVLEGVGFALADGQAAHRRRRPQPLLGRHAGEHPRPHAFLSRRRRGRPGLRRGAAVAHRRVGRRSSRGLPAAAGHPHHRARSGAEGLLPGPLAALSPALPGPQATLRRAGRLTQPGGRDMSRFFGDIAAIKYEGPESDNPLAFRHYDKDRIVLGKRMEDLLRFAVCYWHTFNWHGNDPFGSQTLMRPWFEAGDPLKKAELKLEVAFDLFATLGTPFFTFHDRDVAPEGADLAETNRSLLHIVDLMEKAMEKTGRRLLWGTANLFSHRRYMAGAATNPDPEVFAYAAAQVRQVMDITHRLNGANYVLWGGREGYESLLNTDLKREADQIGRFMSMVVDYKHKIGFKGTILIEPKPQEPTKHQYDYDSATVYAFLQKYGLANEIKLNIETNHATLAGHSFEHELAYAAANGILGSIDMNRGDPQNGWDTDQFPNNVSETALALYVIFKHGGFGTGGVNFDAKIRRQSIDPADLFHAHIGGMDVCARGLVIAAAMIESGKLAKLVEQRYAGWNGDLGKRILAGKIDLAQLADHVLQRKLEPTPRSGQQERLENLVNSYI